MSEISNLKSWTKIYQNTPSDANSHKEILKLFKNSLITAGWSHISSSNFITTSSSVDLWSSYSDIVYSTGAHSWIVLGNDNLFSGFKMCIDLNFTTTYSIRVYIATSGYSGGSITEKPFATNEIEITNGATTWLYTTTGTSKQYNMIYSSDSQSFRTYLGYSNNTLWVVLDRQNTKCT